MRAAITVKGADTGNQDMENMFRVLFTIHTQYTAEDEDGLKRSERILLFIQG